MRLRTAGPLGVLAELADLETVHRLDAAVRAAQLPGVVDVVPGYRTLLVTSCSAASAARVRKALPLLDLPGLDQVRRTVVEIPVVYDGEDLAEVARLTDLPVAEVVRRHTAPEYLVAFLGFAPGFPYLLGLDPALHVPRRATPRTSVPAGSVALAGVQTGIYPAATPGGWQLVGRTDVALFDGDREPPALLAAGDRLRFAAA
ncbi:MAG: 5-oxoprolinase subunit PxpB [Mycobacteriales bacterium]